MEHPDADRLRKVYVEPTNACNLACTTCVRHAWDEPEGFMAWETFAAIVDGLAEAPAERPAGTTAGEQGTVAFMGLGEPLLHPRILDMVRLAKQHDLRAEVTTNALLLDERMAAGFLAAGLDQLVVSIDGASAEAFGRVRSGASLERVVENVRRLHDAQGPNYGPGTRIGVEFVAMRSNVGELPGLGRLAAQLGATFIVVTNVLAYTPELQAETLYDHRASSLSRRRDLGGAALAVAGFRLGRGGGRRARRGAHPLRPRVVLRRRPGGHPQPLSLRAGRRLRGRLARWREPLPAVAAHVHLLRARPREEDDALGGRTAAGRAAGGDLGEARLHSLP